MSIYKRLKIIERFALILYKWFVASPFDAHPLPNHSPLLLILLCCCVRKATWEYNQNKIGNLNNNPKGYSKLLSMNISNSLIY